MPNNDPRPDEFFNGKLPTPMLEKDFFGRAGSRETVKISFPRDENGQNTGKDASGYKEEFDLLLWTYDFEKHKYKALIHLEGKNKSELSEIIGSTFVKETPEGRIITGITFFATSGGYPIKEKVEVYEQTR